MDDVENIYLLNMDPDVIKYTGDLPFNSIEETKIFLMDYDQYKKYGVGRLAVENKVSGEFMGWCGLKYTWDNDTYDIGFRFFKKYWNQGYATEAAKACIEFGFQKIGMPFIVGRAMKRNVASIKVLEKSGLTYYKDNPCGGEDGVIYKIDK